VALTPFWYHSEATGEAMAKFDIVFEGGGAKGAAFAGALEVLFTAGTRIAG